MSKPFPSLTDASLAHGLARLGLGINIALHGWTRIPKFSAFSSGLQEQFAGSPLPGSLVQVAAYGIVTAESVLGLLLLLGLWLRFALAAGALLICTLLFGVCLIQNWNAAGSQMVYLAFFAGLLATASHDRLSLDAWRKR
ncbi:DoxX protein [Opitutaceae bacterium TAV1]|nr:DoxX protein [Opitutaceae bacterium TAV1]